MDFPSPLALTIARRRFYLQKQPATSNARHPPPDSLQNRTRQPPGPNSTPLVPKIREPNKYNREDALIHARGGGGEGGGKASQGLET